LRTGGGAAGVAQCPNLVIELAGVGDAFGEASVQVCGVRGEDAGTVDAAVGAQQFLDGGGAGRPANGAAGQVQVPGDGFEAAAVAQRGVDFGVTAPVLGLQQTDRTGPVAARRGDRPGRCGRINRWCGRGRAGGERVPDAAQVTGHGLLHLLGDVVPQVPPVSDLDRLQRTGHRGFGVRAAPVSADHLDLRMHGQPCRDGGGFPVGSRSTGRLLSRSMTAVP
jgi:hypothetical protein